MMRSVVSLSFVCLLSGCGLFDRDRCDGIESEYIAGFDVTGLALAPNGRGYLSGIARFGDCGGTWEGRLFKVDTEAQTAVLIAIGFLPGKVLVAPDGERALVMGYKKPFVGLLGGVPGGAILVSGTSLSTVNLGGTALDIQPSNTGWIASAGAGGSWHVGFDGARTLLAGGPSRCGVEAGTQRILCAGSEVKVLGSSGTVVDSFALGSEPAFAVASGDTAIIVHGTAATAIVSGAVDQTYNLLGAVGGDVWVAPGGANALVQGSLGTRWLKLIDGTSDVTGDNLFASDVGFSEDGRFGLIAHEVFGYYGVVDFVAEDLGAEVGPGRISAFENLGGNVFVLAGGNDMQVFRPGDVVPNAFQKIEVVSTDSVVRLATWDLVVD